jgi:hypothetical protein
MKRAITDPPKAIRSKTSLLIIQYPLERLAPPLARAAPAFALGRLQPLRNFFRLLKVFQSC